MYLKHRWGNTIYRVTLLIWRYRPYFSCTIESKNMFTLKHLVAVNLLRVFSNCWKRKWQWQGSVKISLASTVHTHRDWHAFLWSKLTLLACIPLKHNIPLLVALERYISRHCSHSQAHMLSVLVWYGLLDLKLYSNQKAIKTRRFPSLSWRYKWERTTNLSFQIPNDISKLVQVALHNRTDPIHTRRKKR